MFKQNLRLALIGILSLIGIMTASAHNMLVDNMNFAMLDNVEQANMLIHVGPLGSGIVLASNGFLPSATPLSFNVTNFALGSQNFTSTYWTAQGSSGGTIPTVSGPVTAQDGSTTAYQVSFPTVTGANTYGVLSQTPTNLNGYPLTIGFYVKVVSGNASGNIYGTMSVGTSFQRAAIPNTDNNWHLVTFQVPANFYTFSQGAAALQIGVNKFDSGQASTTGTIVIDITNFFMIENPIGSYMATNDPNFYADLTTLVTTNAAVTKSINIPIPAHTAFRNFGEASTPQLLLPDSNNPIISEKSTEIYAAGGVSDPYGPYISSGGFLWGFGNCTSTITHTNWMAFCLFKSTDGKVWTEDTTNAPYLKASGSSYAIAHIGAGGTGYGTSLSGQLTYTNAACPVPVVINASSNGSGVISSVTYVSGVCNSGSWPTTQTTWVASGGLSSGTGAQINFTDAIGTGLANVWQLHPAWLPFGCTIPSGFGAGSHTYCVIYSARSTAASFTPTNIFLAWSDTVNGVYTPYGCGSSGTCAAPTPIIAATISAGQEPGSSLGAFGNNGLASVVNVGGSGGTNYIYTSNAAENATWTNEFSTPASGVGAGTTISWLERALPVAVSGNWTFGTNYQDSQVFLNSCGFYEYFFTSYSTTPVTAWNNKQQVIGYAISNSHDGPWWVYPAPIVPGTSSMYFSTPYIGDAVPLEINGQFILEMNYDNATNTSRAVDAAMPDNTSCP